MDLTNLNIYLLILIIMYMVNDANFEKSIYEVLQSIDGKNIDISVKYLFLGVFFVLLTIFFISLFLMFVGQIKINSKLKDLDDLVKEKNVKMDSLINESRKIYNELRDFKSVSIGEINNIGCCDVRK